MGKPHVCDEGHEEFFRRESIEALARAQGVHPAERLEDFIGGWPADQLEDGFEEAVLAWRERDARGELG